MNSAHASQIGSQPAANGIEPLTKAKLDGTPYKRHPDVEAEIQAVISSAPSSWEVSKLKSETLVYLARSLWRRKDQVLIGRVIDCLGRRITRIARDFTGGFDESTAEEFVFDIAAEVNALIFANVPSRRSEFLEIAFRFAIRRRAINKCEKVQMRLDTEVIASTISVVGDGEAGDDFVGLIPGKEDTPDDAAVTAEFKRLIPTGLNAVTDQRHRDAVVLHYLHEWPISHKDPSIPTLRSHFKMSERQIYNWLKTALGQMREAMGGEHE